MMIKCAKRALPGVVMTLLLSVPAMAEARPATTSTTVQSDPKPKSGVLGSRIRRDPKGSVLKVATPRVGTVRGHVTARARLREVSINSSHHDVGYRLRHVRFQVRSGTGAAHLIEDATSWGTPDDATASQQNGGQQTGVASWYGGTHWQGRRTSAGTHYNEGELTAAHATLPLGSKVRVMRKDGQRSVVVTINDRPGSRTRIIDLSRAAAQELGMIDSGTAVVTLQPL